jgi:hypothetical protein
VDGDDTLIWTGGDDSSYLTTKNVYLEILSTQDNAIIDGWRCGLWKWTIQLKIKIFTWLEIEGKIHSWETLQRKGWEGPSCCPLCKCFSEDINHLFITCIFTISIWKRLKTLINLKDVWKGPTQLDFFKLWTTEKTTISYLSTLTCWYIWLERNYALFKNTPPSVNQVTIKTMGALIWKPG